MLALFAAQLALGVLVFTNKDEVGIEIKKGLLEGFEKYGKDDVALTNTIDLMETEVRFYVKVNGKMLINSYLILYFTL